jgi:hypothetical protein
MAINVLYLAAPQDCYSALGVLSTATKDQVREAFIERARELEVQDIFANKSELVARQSARRQLQYSYKVLVDTTTRQNYDNSLRFHKLGTGSTTEHLVYWTLLSANAEQMQAGPEELYPPFKVEYLTNIIDILTKQNAAQSIHATTYILTKKLIETCGAYLGEVVVNTWLKALLASRNFSEDLHLDPLELAPETHNIQDEKPKNWSRTYHLLKRNSILLYIHEHLRPHGSYRICNLLIQYWVPEIVKRKAHSGSTNLLNSYILNKNLNKAIECFKRTPGIERLPANDAGVLEYANLLMALSRYNVLYDKAIYYIFSLVSKLHGEAAVLEVTEAFLRFIPAHSELNFERVFRILGGIASEDGPGPTTAANFLDVAYRLSLNCYRGHDRGRTAIPLKLMAAGIPEDMVGDFMYEIAEVIAQAKFLTSRQAFRLLHACYTAVVSQNAELHPSIPRGLFHFGITKRGIDGKWMSTERLAWLLELIERTEGKSVAADIDKTIYEWRGWNMRHAKTDFEQVWKPLSAGHRIAASTSFHHFTSKSSLEGLHQTFALPS